MYTVVLYLHSYIRWLVVLFGLIAAAKMVVGASGRRPWTSADAATGRMFMMTLDLQVLLGILLYLFLSPVTIESFPYFGSAMSNRALRFWLVEHGTLMLVALALAHIGVATTRRVTDDREKFRRARLYFVLAFLAILAAMPWPMLIYGRPLLRTP